MLAGVGLGYAPRDGDEIAWVFDTPDILIHNTFTYRRDSNTWQWVIDTGNAGDLSPFVRLALTRK